MNSKFELTKGLKRMGWTFIALGALTSAIIFFMPSISTNYWLSPEGKQGFYVLSGFLVFLGLYCLGAIWRKKHYL